MKLAVRIVLIVILIIIVLLVVAAIMVQIPRYVALKRKRVLFSLDKTFEERRLFSKRMKNRVVVTLSTIPDRIHLLGPTIASILDQSYLPDEICINIPMLSRKGHEYVIPKWLSRLKSIKIHRVEKDEGPGTKLLPTLRRESTGTKIIVIDDDNIYHSRVIETLLKVHYRYEKKGKLVAVTNYGVSLDDEDELPNLSGRIWAIFAKQRKVDLLQGFSGFLVAKEMFPEQAYNIHDGPIEAISVDDIWFSGWLNLNHVHIVAAPHTFKHLPIVNFGEIRFTTALAHGENINFIRDGKIIKWFVNEKGMKTVCKRKRSKHGSK